MDRHFTVFQALILVQMKARGHIRIFDWDGSAWNQAVEITGSCRLDFANYAAISSDGSKIAIGSTESEALSGNYGTQTLRK